MTQDAYQEIANLIDRRYEPQHVQTFLAGADPWVIYAEADILYINTVPPYPEQESEELGDEVIALLNTKTDRIENFEVLFFTSRLLRKEMFSLPVSADLRASAAA